MKGFLDFMGKRKREVISKYRKDNHHKMVGRMF